MSILDNVFSLFSDASLFGRCFEILVFQYRRNWITVNLGTEIVQIIPNTETLNLNSKHGRLSLFWNTIGFTIEWTEPSGRISAATSEGEIHSIHFDEDQKSIEISFLDSPVSKVSLNSEFSVPFKLSEASRVKKIIFSDKTIETNVIQFSSNFQTRIHNHAIVFLHGGPFQRYGNEYNPLFKELLKNNFQIYVPEYFGDPTTGNKNRHRNPCETDQIASLGYILGKLHRRHSKVIVMGHSFGAYLGYKVARETNASLLITINGVFDRQSLHELTPLTFPQMALSFKVEEPEKTASWVHLHALEDPIIPISFFEKSLNRIQNRPDNLYMLETSEHEVTHSFYINPIFQSLNRILGTRNT